MSGETEQQTQEQGSTETPATPANPLTEEATPSTPEQEEGGDPTLLEGEGEGEAEGEEPFVPLTAEDVTIPEGFEVDEETLGSALEVMNDQALSPKERLQKLVDLQAAISQQGAEAQAKAWSDMQDQWRAEVQSDPEIGGAKMAENLARIKKGLEAAGAGKEFFEALRFTGAGNNPHIVRMFHKLTKPYAEGGPVSGAPAQGKLSLEQKLYPSMSKQE